MSTVEDIKADPGFYALDRVCYPDSNRIEVVKVPVIGWRISNDAEMDGLFAFPICAEPMSDLWCGEILHPDGTITPTHMWQSYDHFMKAVTFADYDCNRLDTTVGNRNSELETKPKQRCIVRRADTIPMKKWGQS
jgi:hypothetical protein